MQERKQNEHLFLMNLIQLSELVKEVVTPRALVIMTTVRNTIHCEIDLSSKRPSAFGGLVLPVLTLNSSLF